MKDKKKIEGKREGRELERRKREKVKTARKGRIKK